MSDRRWIRHDRLIGRVDGDEESMRGLRALEKGPPADSGQRIEAILDEIFTPARDEPGAGREKGKP